MIFKFLPNDKILDLSKLKAYADGNINVTPNEICFSKGRNIVINEENTSCMYFLLFTQCFSVF